MKLRPAGEQGIVIELGEGIDEAINSKVHLMTKAISENLGERIIEVVPTYRSLLVYFDPLLISRAELSVQLENLYDGIANTENIRKQGRIVHIPVCYGGEVGPDLEFVARYNQLTISEVIAIHTAKLYKVYMLGFTPGFPYLGGMSERIAAPRLEKPRTIIPAGSVGIAGSQTGLYPIESPGGWRIIGRTPIMVFNPGLEDAFLVKAGDWLKFEAVDQQDYEAIKRMVDCSAYEPRITAIHMEVV